MAAPTELIVTGPDGVVSRYRLAEKAVIGRHPDCEVVLTDPMSSRRHCKIERAPDGVFFVEDNGSANGTLFNGESLKLRTLFKNGDTVQIGSTTLVLRIDVPAARSGGTKPVATYEPALSIVRLEDEGGNAPSVDFAQKAGAQMVSEEEKTSSDVAKLQKSLKRAAEHLKLLFDVSQEIGASLDPHKLLNTCLDKLFEVFPQADRGIIVLYSEDGLLPETLTPEKDLGVTLDRRKGAMTKVKFRTASSVQDNEIKLSRTVVNRVRANRQSELQSDATGDAAGMSMARFEIKSLMCAPLLIGKDDLGIIQLETKSRQQAFNPDDLSVVTAIAGQVAVAIRNSDNALRAADAAAQRQNLSRFLSPQLVEQVIKGGLSVELGGAEKNGTIFFSDLVGFTKLAGKMSAQNVVSLLNRYFTVMQNIIFRRGGSIDKCAGDEIMAHWGLLGETADFTLSAVTAAVEMQIALLDFNRDEALKNEIILPSIPLGHGIGLNTGIVCAGNIGSDRKIEFTVIGDTVNKGSRIAHMPGRGQTFIGVSTYEEIKNRSICIRMPDCPVKNVDEPLQIFSVLGIVPATIRSTPSPAPAAAVAREYQTDDLLFCVPCVLKATDLSVSGVVTRITRGEAASKIMLKVDRCIPVGAPVVLEWNVYEKASLPVINGVVEKCWQPVPIPSNDSSSTPATDAPGSPGTAGAIPVSASKGGTAIISNVLPTGTLVLKVQLLPSDVAQWHPGLLLQADLKSHEEIVRV